MTEAFQYKMRYQVYAGGYRSQTDDLETAKLRADFCHATGNRDVMVLDSPGKGRTVIYRPGKGAD